VCLHRALYEKERQALPFRSYLCASKNMQFFLEGTVRSLRHIFLLKNRYQPLSTELNLRLQQPCLLETALTDRRSKRDEIISLRFQMLTASLVTKLTFYYSSGMLVKNEISPTGRQENTGRKKV